MRGLFVTGTDTGVGKTVLAAAIVATLRAKGVPVTALKPVITGLDEPPADSDWPPDHVLLARIAGCAPDQVMLTGYGRAVSPHLAAELEGRPMQPHRLVAAIGAAAGGRGVTVIEGVGGLLVPLAPRFDVRALARAIGVPVVIAARPGLGTINHTLLTLEAARLAALEVAGVVLTPWPKVPERIHESNRETIERLGEVEVSTLGRVARADAAQLEAAGRRLPLESWFAPAGSDRLAS